jgi:anti-sigma B factor antagonist
MEIRIEEIDGNVVAFLEGSFDTAAAPEAEKIMDPLNYVEGKDIIFDCTNLEYISSAGLRIFLGILQNAEDRGGHVYIKGLKEKVHDTFVLTGFTNIFEFIS